MLTEEYRKQRQIGFAPRDAYRNAKILVAWAKLKSQGLVRLSVEADTDSSIASLEGDTYNPAVNTDINPTRLKKEQKEFHKRVSDEGVWGIIGEFRVSGRKPWASADACWGFVGEDWKNSGYDTDIMLETMSQLRQSCKGIKQAFALVGDLLGG